MYNQDNLATPTLNRNLTGRGLQYDQPNIQRGLTTNPYQQQQSRIDAGNFERSNTQLPGFNDATNPYQTQPLNMGYQRSLDDIITSMAKKINDQKIQSFSEFFYQYDVYQTRTFQSWELAIIFLDYITKQEADALILELNRQRMSTTIDFQLLVQELQKKLPYIQLGTINNTSIYANKFKSPQVQQHLDYILNYFKQNGLDPVSGFDRFFNKSYTTDREFLEFLMQINLRTNHQQEQQQLFEYFTIGTNLFSKINFVQALNVINNNFGGSSSTFGMTVQQQLNQQPYQGSIRNDPDNLSLTKFINGVRSFMQMRNGLSFEGLLAAFKIPNQQYIESYYFEDMCKGLNLYLSPNEMQQIINSLDEDRLGKIKTWCLRQKIEAQMMGVTNNSSYSNLSPTQPNQINKLGQNPNLKQWLEKIRIALQQFNIIDIPNQFRTTSVYLSKVVVDLDEFLHFLRAPGINFKESEAMEISQEFLIKEYVGYKSQLYIDLQKFEEQVFASQQSQETTNNNYRYYNVIQQSFEAAQKYILMRGGNLITFFQESDINKDNFIQRQELKLVLSKLQNKNISDDEINIIFAKMDQNNDGKISYLELCKVFAEFSNTKAIKDETHWSYPFFESIRRILIQTGQSLTQLFGVTMQSISSKVTISKDQFFQALNRLNINYYGNQQKLLQLLDADQVHQWEIDFIHFAEMVGMNYDQSTQQNSFINQYQSNTIDNLYSQKTKTFYKIMQLILEKNQIPQNILSLLFKRTDHQGKGIIQQSDFIGVLNEIDQERRLDQNLIREISEKFSTSIGVQKFVEYQKFLNRLEGEIQKYKLLDYIFLTLCGIMKQNSVSTLSELFSRFDKNIITNGFDKSTLERFLQSQGIIVSQSELSLILIEYDTKGTGQYLDFNSFDQDFKEFQSTSSYFNVQLKQKADLYSKYVNFSKEYSGFDASKFNQNNYNDFLNRSNSIHSQKSLQPNRLDSIKQTTPNVLAVQQKIGRYIDSNPRFQFTQILLEHDFSKTGIINRDDFQDLMFKGFMLSNDEISHLLYHYDPMNRNSIRIEDFLTDIKDHIYDTNIKIQIANVISQLQTGSSLSSGSQTIQSDVILKRYSKDFEEISKAIQVRRSDTFKWFENYSKNKQSLNNDDFRQSLRTLNIEYLRPSDIDSIFEALQPDNRGFINIYKIDEAIRQNSILSSNDMQEELLEKIIRAFNGDDAYILEQLSKLDKIGRGMMNIQLFIDYFVRNSPSHIKFSANDIGYLAQCYMNTKISQTDMDYSKFHSDLVRMKRSKNITQGYYKDFQLENRFAQNNENNYGNEGHRNILLSQYSKDNTVSSQERIQKFPGFRINLQISYLEDIAKSTYVKGQLVQNYFQRYSSQGMNLYEADFARAIQSLDIGWSQQTCNMVFNEIDKAFNNQRQRMMITAENIDQAVSFSCENSLEDIHHSMLTVLAQHLSQKGMNLRNDILYYDNRGSKLISVENMVDLILNKLRVPQLMQLDVVFMCKRYIETIPNMVHYEKLLDDVESLTRGKFSNVNDSKQIADFIRKTCIINRTTIEQHFGKYCKMKDILTQQEFMKAIEDMDLIKNGICTRIQMDAMFKEIDTSDRKQITIQQIAYQINKLSFKQTKEFQEEIIDDICSRANAKNIIMEKIFLQDDQSGKGYVSIDIFEKVLARQFQIKQLDAKLLTNRYIEKGDYVNYRIFLNDYQSKDKQLNRQLTQTPYQDNINVNQQVKILLKKISDYIQQNRIQLSNAFSLHERGQSTGIITNQQFLQSINSLNLPLNQADKTVLTEQYTIPRQPNSLDYLRFLSDVKLNTGNTPQLQSLTVQQKELYNNIQKFIVKNNLVNKIVSSFQDKDSNNKGYLTLHLMKETFKENNLQLSSSQFNTLFGTLDTNSYGEYNYKQMLELMYGQEETKRLFSLQSNQIYSKQKTITNTKFMMPQQPINASNNILGNIGKKVIASNINYEDEFKRRLGSNQVSSPNPKVTEQDIIEVLRICKVFFSNDENIEIQAFITTNKDRNGQVDLCSFLQSIGLPPQTLGPNAEKNLPKRILNEKELAECQGIIIKIRQELNKMNRTPQQIFEKLKLSPQDLSILPITFKLTLANDLGLIGKQITEQQLDLLSYYLTQEVPGQISYKKLYLAFTLSDREPPLKQEGTEEIKRYQTQLSNQIKKGIPLEILDLLHYIRKNSLTMQQIFKTTQKGMITRQEFENSLKEVGFASKSMSKIIEALDIKQTRITVSLDKLNEYMRQTSSEARQMTPQIARDRYNGFDPKTRQDLQKISDFMKRNNITLQKLYVEMDCNRDGSVDKQEFVNRLSYMNIPGLQLNDLGQIYDALDINNDNIISINEFGMFIEGAKMQRQQRMQELDPKLIEDMKKEILTLFQQFDENGDGFVTADEIFKSMMAIGQRITIQDAKDMIASIDQNGDGKLERHEFVDLMLPKMKDELLHQEDSVEDLRAMFLEADIDHSGTLSVDEMYSVILKLGAEITIEELMELMNEIDIDRNGVVDIDEFVALLSMGDAIQFKSAIAKNTFLGIKKAKQMKPLDFFKCFKNMPMNFVPSFFTEKWAKSKKNLPSSVFKPQIDPKTMLYKDMLPILSENIPPNQTQKAFQPRVRPLLTQLGCEIAFEQCEGVPIPQNGSGFDRSQIVKRVIRVGLYDTTKKDFIANAVQVNAQYNQSDEDIWNFNPPKEFGTNPVLFKTSEKDEIVKANIQMIFELVVYVRFGEKVTEMCCGWSQLDMSLLDRQMTHKLPIKGGSPNAEVIISDSDVHTKRSGIKHSIMKVINSKINSQIILNVRPHTKFTEETKFHLDLLPSTCFIQKRLLYFVSGFRNYAAEKLLKESSVGTFKHPEGDIIISNFPKIIDSIDIVELLITIWQEDVWATTNTKQKLNIDYIVMKSKEFILKLYPVLYSEEFQYKESNPTHSASGDQQLMRVRENLIKSALRFNSTNPKTKFDQPLESLTTFKPFTVRELEFEVWDTNQAKQDRYMKQYEEIGLLNNNNDKIMGGSFNQNPLSQQNFNITQLPKQPLSLVNAMNQAFGK